MQNGYLDEVMHDKKAEKTMDDLMLERLGESNYHQVKFDNMLIENPEFNALFGGITEYDFD